MTVPERKTGKTSGIAKKMMIIFMTLMLAMGVCLFLSSTIIYSQVFRRAAMVNLGDLADQTTNNLDAAVVEIEDIHVQILASPVVQEQLRITNRADTTEFIKRNVDLTLERELATAVLLNANVQSAHIVSKSGVEYSITNIDVDPMERPFTEEEIYAANGTTLWTLVGEENHICTAKAILDLRTMMPIGYMNIVFKQSFFEDIVRDNSTEFSSHTYVVDPDGVIVSTNTPMYLNTVFPISLDVLGEGHTQHYDPLNDEFAFYYAGDEMTNGWVLIQSVSTHEMNENIYRNIAITGGIMLILLAVGFIFLRAATQYIVRPTQVLVESMKQFGEGNLESRAEVISKDEIGQIGREYNRMAENIESLIEKVYKMEITQKQAEIDFLCMQINPHFLYNTLDTISWMAIGNQNSDISEMTIALADLLRAMVKHDRFVTVEEELRTVNDYLYIQKQRFGEKITVKYEVHEAAGPCVIPNFILQPLIENAIIHGLEPKLDRGTLWIEVFPEIEKKMIQEHENGFEKQILEKEILVFRVTDDGVGMTENEIRELYEQCEANDTKQNIGLKNVYRRLILCYGNESKLSIESTKGKGTRIEFRIPVLDTEHNE